MTKFEELQQIHQRLLDHMDEISDKAAFVREVQAYVTRVCDEAVDVPGPRDRDHLRANLRYWASYLYDATGTYPNTTMRPARLTESAVSRSGGAAYAPPSPPRAATSSFRFITIGLGVVLLLLLVLLGLIFINRQGEREQLAAPDAMIQATNTAIAAIASMTPSPAPTRFATTETVPATSPPLPPATRTLQPTATPAVFVATFPNAPELSLITPTPNPEIIIPVTGGGGAIVWLAKSTIGLSKEGCGRRSVLVTVPPGTFDVELSAIGSGEVVASTTLKEGTSAASFDLSQRSGASAYLLQVTDPDPQSNQVFAGVIIRFANDCSRDVQAIAYVEAPDALRVTIDPSRPDPALPLRWYLATWGPAPGVGVPDTWVAHIILQATGGNSHYVYFADNKDLPADSSTAEDKLCQPIHQSVGVASNGLASSQTVLIMPPFPECTSP